MNSYDIVNAIFNNDAITLETAFRETISEKIATKLNDNKQKLEKKVFKSTTKPTNKKEEPLDHMKHFNNVSGNGKVSPKDIFVDKNINKLSSILNKFKPKTQLKEDDEGLPLSKFNNLASDDQKSHLKSLLASGKHLAANKFINSVLNKEDIT